MSQGSKHSTLKEANFNIGKDLLNNRLFPDLGNEPSSPLAQKRL